MAALDPATTPQALADVDVELPADRPARDLGLELLGAVGLDQAPRAVRAGVGQTGFVDLVDLVGRGWRPMAVLAMLVARFAPGALGVGLGRPFAEGGGLTLGGAAGLLKFRAEARHLGGQRLDLPVLLLHEQHQFLITGGRSGHRG